MLPAQRRITRKRFVAPSAPLSAEHRRLSVQVAMRKLLLSQVAVQKAAATMPVLVDATLTPAVAATATSSPVMATCSNLRWSGMESEWGWEPETDQGSALTRWVVGSASRRALE